MFKAPGCVNEFVRDDVDVSKSNESFCSKLIWLSGFIFCSSMLKCKLFLNKIINTNLNQHDNQNMKYVPCVYEIFG